MHPESSRRSGCLANGSVLSFMWWPAEARDPRLQRVMSGPAVALFTVPIRRRDEHRNRATDRRGAVTGITNPRPAGTKLLAPRPCHSVRCPARITRAGKLRRHPWILRAPYRRDSHARRAPLHEAGAGRIPGAAEGRHATAAHPRARRTRAAIAGRLRCQLRPRRPVRRSRHLVGDRRLRGGRSRAPGDARRGESRPGLHHGAGDRYRRSRRAAALAL